MVDQIVRGDIFVIDVGSGREMNLTNTPLVREQDPDWYKPGCFGVRPEEKMITLWGMLKMLKFGP